MKRISLCFLAVVLCGSIYLATDLRAAEPITIAVPTSLGFLEGKESLKAVQMAVDEINAKGGVKVGNEKRPFKIADIDIRDAAPGVPDTAHAGGSPARGSLDPKQVPCTHEPLVLPPNAMPRHAHRACSRWLQAERRRVRKPRWL